MSEKPTQSTEITAPRRGRPRKSPDDLLSRKKLISTGLAYLTERGFSDVSVDEILMAAGATKGSFYHHFRSKADFGMALVEAYHDYFAGKLRYWFEKGDLTPLEQIKAFIKDAEQGMARHGFARGCLIGNLGQEMAALPPELSKRLIEVLEEWQKITAACLKEAQAQKQISLRQDADGLAEFFWIGWEGAVLRAKLERKPEPLRHFAKGFLLLLVNE